MSIQLATAPVSWGIMEIKEVAPTKSYREVLDEIKQAGYTGTELGPYGFLPTDPEILAAELQARGLTLTSAFVPVRLKDVSLRGATLQTVHAVGQLLSAMKCEYLVLADALDERRMAIAGRVDSEPASMLTSAEWKTVAETCHTIAKECRSMGLKTVFHHHVGSFIETPEEILRLCELTDPQLLGICLDTGHYVYGGGDPLEAFDLFGSRIQYLHFKDINREALENVRREKLGFVEGVRRGVFCSLGNGCVDFPKIVKRLNQMKYHGWIVFEQDVDAGYYNGPTPLEAATESRLYIQRILEN